ncbi:probable caffeoyl-CoA O-methyltransferase 1 [Dermacentor silvarum]|uniref:probable caffeoyl-CoA O-methyltransferase 1 n=1 Tax=Dermacentor silvarum TaxID=543639 RepID=UPI0021011B16|nr:probable caffeoyl-CoA O-methyltransferase 1 [Dermacentor silvarum]
MAENNGRVHFVKPSLHLGPQVSDYVANHSGRLNPVLAKLIQVTQKMPRSEMMSDSSELQLFQILLKAMGARYYLEIDDLIAQGKSNFFDFIFIDADKASYDEYYEKSLQLVRRHGIIAVDNVLWKGKVFNPAFDDPVTESVRRLNRKLASDDRVEISMLTLSDGVTFAFKK